MKSFETPCVRALSVYLASAGVKGSVLSVRPVFSGATRPLELSSVVLVTTIEPLLEEEPVKKGRSAPDGIACMVDIVKSLHLLHTMVMLVKHVNCSSWTSGTTEALKRS
jgi:hypothetical protein